MDRIASLEDVVEAHAENIGRMEVVDVARGAEAERRQVGGKDIPIDRRNIGTAAAAFGNIAVADPRRDEMAKSVDLPTLILVIEHAAGA